RYCSVVAGEIPLGRQPHSSCRPKPLKWKLVTKDLAFEFLPVVSPQTSPQTLLTKSRRSWAMRSGESPVPGARLLVRRFWHTGSPQTKRYVPYIPYPYALREQSAYPVDGG